VDYFLHSGPGPSASSAAAASFHWHLEICPRTSIPNGFELGSGLSINTINPEESAERLRAAL
jgi:UDPglucose--hexose-1-phosphate uridylyltransferase